MAGLVAVMSQDGSTPVPREDLDGLLRAYEDLRGSGATHVQSVGTRAFCALIDGHVGGDVQQDGGAWCATVGTLHAPGSAARAALGDLDGQFAAVRYDDASDTVQVISDPFGMQALFVAEREGRTYVSTSATVLARHLGAAPDPLGAALFLRTGRLFASVTHWQGVRRLGPATALAFPSGSAMAESTYWRPIPDQRQRGMSLDQTADHCAEVILDALRARLTTEPCLAADLTGGFDSRLITAGLTRLGVPFTAQTSGELETVDVRLAREVAKAGGFQWHQERLPQGWAPSLEDLRTATAWADGALDAMQLSDVLWRQHLRAQSCGLVVTGGGGEHFGPEPWMQEFLRAGRSRQVNFDNYMSMRALTPMDVSFLREDPTARLRQYIHDTLVAHGAHLATQPNTTQLDAFYIYRSIGHFGAYRSASEAYIRTEVPFHYKDVFVAGFSTPYRYRNGYQLHRAVIERLNPTIANVETERGGPAMRMRPSNAHRFAPYYVRLGRKAVRKVRGRPAPPSAEGPAQAGYRVAVQNARAEGLLDPATMRSGDVYDPASLEALLNASELPGFGSWDYVGRILTLELTLRSVDGAALSALPR